MEVDVKPFTWMRVQWSWKLFQARRAEAAGQWELGLRLIDEAAEIKALWTPDRVIRAMLLLRGQRKVEAHSAFVALWNEFEGSDDPDLQYLQRYCEAVLGAIWGSPSRPLNGNDQPDAIPCNRLLKMRFPIPDHDLCTAAG